MNKQKPRLAIIDDDPFVIEYLQKELGEKFPNIDTVGIQNPVAPVGYDVYIIDREFDDDRCGQELVRARAGRGAFAAR